LIIKGFKEGKAVEELCRRCSYKSRFTESREALATKG
jgi:hypothetical protein